MEILENIIDTGLKIVRGEVGLYRRVRPIYYHKETNLFYVLDDLTPTNKWMDYYELPKDVQKETYLRYKNSIRKMRIEKILNED